LRYTRHSDTRSVSLERTRANRVSLCIDVVRVVAHTHTYTQMLVSAARFQALAAIFSQELLERVFIQQMAQVPPGTRVIRIELRARLNAS